jgi:AcrR family transcriptional regulator
MRILVAASDLFSRKGYAATSTREIAQAVGIQQPSLFHHFAAKTEIAKVLLSYSLDEPTAVAEKLAAAQGPATERLYAYVVFDTTYLLGSPFHLGGLSHDDVMELPEFRPWHLRRARLRTARAAMIAQGIQSGEFIDVGADFATEVLNGIFLSVTSMYSGRHAADPEELATRIAAFALRGLSANPAAIGELAAHPPTVAGLVGRTPAPHQPEPRYPT